MSGKRFTVEHPSASGESPRGINGLHNSDRPTESFRYHTSPEAKSHCYSWIFTVRRTPRQPSNRSSGPLVVRPARSTVHGRGERGFDICSWAGLWYYPFFGTCCAVTDVLLQCGVGDGMALETWKAQMWILYGNRCRTSRGRRVLLPWCTTGVCYCREHVCGGFYIFDISGGLFIMA